MRPNLRNYFVNSLLKHLLAILWLTINGALFFFTFMYYYNGPQFYYLHQMLGYGLCISRASASCINLNSAFLLLPMCKRLLTRFRSFNVIMRRQSRRMLDHGRSFHIYCGYVLCTLAACHCGAHAYNAVYFSKHYNSKYQELNVAKYSDQNPLLMLVTTLPGITGVLLVVVLIFIALFASSPIRKENYNRFWETHHLFIVYYLLLFLHAMDGVLKYQTNLSEHVPGCMIVVEKNSTKSSHFDPIAFPEPHPEPHYVAKSKRKRRNDQRATMIKNKMMNKKTETENFLSDQFLDNALIPEPEPMPQGGSSNKNINELRMIEINGSWVTISPCNQPPPEFSSCSKEVWKWVCIPLSLYVLEKILRLLYSSNHPARIESFSLHPDNVLELTMSQDKFTAKPGQSILLRCPAISKIEVHPFSLTSVPFDKHQVFRVHIKVVGDWTKKLLEIFKEKQNTDKLKINSSVSSCSSCAEVDSRKDTCLIQVENTEEKQNRLKANDFIKNRNGKLYDQASYEDRIASSKSNCCRDFNQCQINVRTEKHNDAKRKRFGTNRRNIDLLELFIEGPIGSSMEDIFKYRVSLCVAGGIGVTPFASVLNKLLLDENCLKKAKLTRLYLIWTCKTLQSFSWFIDVIEKLHLKLWKENRPDFFSVQLYLTNPKKTKSTEKSLFSLNILRRSTLFHHRPNLDEIFRDVSNRHKKTTVGIFSCGPPGLVKAVNQSCSRASSKNKTTFVFNKEIF